MIGFWSWASWLDQWISYQPWFSPKEKNSRGQKMSTRIHPLKMSTRIRPFWKKVSTRSLHPVSIRAILFQYFENWKFPLETGTPWGALLKCRMIASNQHSNVFWTFIFIRSFFMIPSPHIVCLRRNQAGKIVKIMQQAKRQQHFDEFFVEGTTGQGKHFGTVGIFPDLPCESEEGSVHLLFRLVPAWFKNVPQGLGNNDLTSFLLL